MEGREGDRRKHPPEAHRIAKTDEGRGSDAASSAAARVSSSCGSPRTSPKASAWKASVEAEYVRAVLDYYLWLPVTATVTSRHDRACARGLFRRGVPLEVVRDAMAVAVARRTFRRGGPLARVRALHFFLPVIDELLEIPCEPGYARYLEHKLQPLAAEKAAQSTTTPRQAAGSAEGAGQANDLGRGRRGCP
jgi:hypothetical protein